MEGRKWSLKVGEARRAAVYAWQRYS
jgi:hypothetical protein